jgi:hypothetical protein
MDITSFINKQYEVAKSRGWDTMYWAVDLHGTLILADYKKMKAEDVVYYPEAMEVMQILTERPDVCLIMYTCSWPPEIKEYQKRFHADGIHFNWINCNPDVDGTEYGDYSKKPYFNVLLDDKAIFDPGEDWSWIRLALPALPILQGADSA